MNPATSIVIRHAPCTLYPYTFVPYTFFSMLDAHHFLLFFAAALLLAITPGPGIFYVLARTLAGGRREGFQSSFGTFFGGLFHVFAAALGVSTILAASAVAFHTIKYAGAAYLIFLGIRMIRSRNIPLPDATAAQKSPPATNTFRPAAPAAFKQGVLTEALNPKTALFFLSFIPQFISPERGQVFLQFATLGIISVALNTAADLVVVALASRALRSTALLTRKLNFRFTFRRREHAVSIPLASAGRTASGLGMISLGAYLALSDAK